MASADEHCLVLQSVLESMLDPYVLLRAVRDEDGRIVDFLYVDANEAACAYNRRPKSEVIGRLLLELFPGHRTTGLIEHYAAVVATGQPYVVDGLVYDSEVVGRVTRTDMRCVPAGDGVALMWRDVTDQHESMQALARSEERFRLLAENASDLVLHTRNGRVAWVSPSITRTLGWHADEIVGRELTSLVHPDDVAVATEEAGNAARRYRCRLLAMDGSYHWFDGSSSPLVRPEQSVDGRVETFRLIDAEVAAEQELDRRARYDQLTGLVSRGEVLARISATSTHSRRTGEQSAVLFCDIDKFKAVNDTYGHAAGDEVLRVMAQRLTACVRSNDVVARLGGDELLVLLTGLHGLEDAVSVAEKIRATAAYPIPFEDSFIQATLSIGVALAVPGEGVDPLIARADAAMLEAKGNGRDQVIAIPSPLSAQRVLVVDDDAFMLDVVEELLRQLGVAEVMVAGDGAAALDVITNELTQPDVVVCDINMAGMDGIELLRHLAAAEYRGALIVMSGSGEELLSSAGDLALMHGLNLLAGLRKPIVRDELLRVLEGMDPRRVLARTDDSATARIGRLSADEVRDGLAAGCVDIHVQPKVTVVDHRVVGAEALLRWRDPVRGMLSPLAVVPVAEAHDLIQDLTLEIFRRSVAVQAQWQSQGLDLRLSVNLSAENLVSLDLPDLFADIAAEAGVSPRSMTLEVTESRLMDRLSVSLEVIGRLRLKGFGISVDDYGMGYSNLRKLKQLPITELKVDRAFVTGADRDSVLRVILGSSVALGHSLGLTVVAEGVEDQGVWELLRSLGCDEAQGWFVGRPMPAQDFAGWKERWDATWA
jgi:diguanylate cyclase (GGDEF)-like protein/PAS domain S-box-containing protein